MVTGRLRVEVEAEAEVEAVAEVEAEGVAMFHEVDEFRLDTFGLLVWKRRTIEWHALVSHSVHDH